MTPRGPGKSSLHAGTEQGGKSRINWKLAIGAAAA